MSFRHIVYAWCIVALAMIANGIFRETVLISVLDRPGAEALSILLGIVIILAVTRPFVIRWASPRTGQLLAVSATWLAMTLVFEFVFGHYVEGARWSEIAGEYRFWDGEMWPVALLTLLVAPFLWVRAAGPHLRSHVR